MTTIPLPEIKIADASYIGAMITVLSIASGYDQS